MGQPDICSQISTEGHAACEDVLCLEVCAYCAHLRFCLQMAWKIPDLKLAASGFAQVPGRRLANLFLLALETHLKQLSLQTCKMGFCFCKCSPKASHSLLEAFTAQPVAPPELSLSWPTNRLRGFSGPQTAWRTESQLFHGSSSPPDKSNTNHLHCLRLQRPWKPDKCSEDLARRRF